VRGLAILASLLISFAAVSAQVEEGEVSVRSPTDTEHFSMRKFIIFVLALFLSLNLWVRQERYWAVSPMCLF